MLRYCNAFRRSGGFGGVPFCAWIGTAEIVSAKTRQTEAIFNMWMGSF
jgi:hypothetical protein